MWIYKISNTINNKIYIGQTINPIEERFNRHINDAIHYIKDTHLARAIRLYGADKFYIEEIDSANTQEELTAKEQYWIQYFDAINSGYNETDATYKCGGNTYKNKTLEEMNQIKEKIRQSKLGGKNPNAKSIKCKNVETGQELFFDSLAEGRNYFNETNHQFISRRCLGTIKNLYLGKWMFAYQNEEYGKYSVHPNASRSHTVLINNLDTNEEQVFYSYRDAERAFNLSKDSLSRGFSSKKINDFIIKNNLKITLLT